MSFNCLFKKIYLIAQNMGIDVACAPRNFHELKCLVNRMVGDPELRQFEQGALRDLEQGGLLEFEHIA